MVFWGWQQFRGQPKYFCGGYAFDKRVGVIAAGQNRLKRPRGDRFDSALRTFKLPADGEAMTVPAKRSPVKHIRRPENTHCRCANCLRQMKRSRVIADDQFAFLQEGRDAAKLH